MFRHNHKQEKELLSIDAKRRIVADIQKRRTFAIPVSHLNIRVRGSVANPYLKIIGAACFALLIFAQLSNIGSTISYFVDSETSLGNFFVADPVYFSVEASTTSPVVLGAGEVLVVPVMVPGELSDLIQYQVKANGTGGDSALCNAIDVLTTAPFPYDGPLAGLATGLTTDTGPWALSFSLVPGTQVTQDTTCSVDLVYQGWNASSTPGQGYTDTQKVSLTFILPASVETAPSVAPSAEPPQEIIIPDATSTEPVVPADTSTTTPDVTPPTDTDTPPVDPPPADTPTPESP